MLRKSRQPNNIQSQKNNNLVKKKLRFNEQNIRETLHEINKDYGLMAKKGRYTPFPRHSDPIPPEDLRIHLQKMVDVDNKKARKNYHDDVTKIETPAPTPDFEYEERKRLKFIKKRKQFNRAEFTIAQQKPTNLNMSAPGPSIGNNWRICNDSSSSICEVPSTLPALLDSTSLSHYHSNVNFETLREIVTQLSQPT